MISPIWTPWKQIYGSLGVGDLRAAPMASAPPIGDQEARKKLA
jgi:hypothetical protein